jgi:hypothetical protein
MQSFIDASEGLPCMNVGTGGDPHCLEIWVLQHLVEGRVGLDAKLQILGIVSGPCDLMVLLTAYSNNVDSGHSIEQGLHMTLTHAAKTCDSDIEAGWCHGERADNAN